MSLREPEGDDDDLSLDALLKCSSLSTMRRRPTSALHASIGTRLGSVTPLVARSRNKSGNEMARPTSSASKSSAARPRSATAASANAGETGYKGLATRRINDGLLSALANINADPRGVIPPSAADFAVKPAVSRVAVVRMAKDARRLRGEKRAVPTPHNESDDHDDASNNHDLGSLDDVLQRLSAESKAQPTGASFGCAQEIHEGVMGKPSYLVPRPDPCATSSAMLAAAADIYAQERARFAAWATHVDAERAAAATGRAGTVFDSVWVEDSLLQLRAASLSKAADAATVFKSLGVVFLITRVVEVMLPPTARSAMLALLEELRACVTVAPDAGTREDDSAPRPPLSVSELLQYTRGRTASDTVSIDEWMSTWGNKRLALEALHLEKLRRARDVKNAADALRQRAAEYMRDMEVMDVRLRDRERATLRMVLLSWRGYVVTTNRKRRSAETLINSMSEQRNRETYRAVMAVLKANVSSEKELRRQRRQFADAQAAALREAKLAEQLASTKATMTLRIADMNEQAETVAEQHWQIVSKMKLDFDHQAVYTKQVEARNECLVDENARLSNENQRWALLVNRAVLEMSGAIDRRNPGRAPGSRRHPELELLYLPSSSTGDPPTPVSTFTTLYDVLDSSMPAGKVLLLFANMCVRGIAPHKAECENFGSDMADGFAPAAAFAAVYPMLLDSRTIEAMAPLARAEATCAALRAVGLFDLVSVTDIVLGVPLRMATLMCVLFRLYASTLRFGTADADLSRLESSELTVPGLRRRPSSRKSSSRGGGSSRRAVTEEDASLADDAVVNRRAVVMKLSDIDTVAWLFPGEEPPVSEQPDPDETLPSALATTAAEQQQRQIQIVQVGPARGVVYHHVDTGIASMEKRYDVAVERHRAWSYLVELTQRDLIFKLAGVRNAMTGELIDEKGRRHMEWFLDVDDDRLRRLVRTNEANAKNEVDRVHVVLQNNYWLLRSVYQHYASIDAGLRMTQDGLHQFLKDIAILKALPKQTIDDALRGAVEDIDLEVMTSSVDVSLVLPTSTNADASRGATVPLTSIAFVPLASEKVRRKLSAQVVNMQISPQVFVFVLCHLAHVKYVDFTEDDDNPPAVGQPPQKFSLHRCLRKLLAEDVLGNASVSTVDVLRQQARFPAVLRAQRKYIKQITKAFRVYSSGLDVATFARTAPPPPPRPMAADDAVRFCRESRLLDTRFGVAEANLLALALSSDDVRLAAVCDEMRSRMNNLSSTAGVVAAGASSTGVPFEVECAQPEDRKLLGMTLDDFNDYLVAIALLRFGNPLVHVSATVGVFYRDVLTASLKELHL